MYKEYKSLSQKPDSSTYVPEELANAQEIGLKKIPKSILNHFDDFVANELKISKEKLWNFYSSEQIDSIGLTILNFKENKSFLIGDETGIGKGRILSGITKWAIENGKKVLFFTERAHLISEFWKDLEDTENTDILINPQIFHSTTKVFNKSGDVVLKGSVKKMDGFKSNGFPVDCNLVLTNYSQVSLKEHKKSRKDVLSKYCKDAVIIMDESHNAAGDSNIREFLEDLQKNTDYIVYSSATFIKDESQISFYEKCLNVNKKSIEFFKKIFKGDENGIVRKMLTYEMTKNLQLWRREHEPLDVKWNVVLCDNPVIDNYINSYSEIINQLFNIVTDISKLNSEESKKINNAWFGLGGTINRLSRNLLLILKIDGLSQEVKKSLSQNHKAVIVIDSTLSSIVQKIQKFYESHPQYAIDNQFAKENYKGSKQHLENDDDDEKINLDENDLNINFSFEEAIKYIINEILFDFIKDLDAIPDELWQSCGLTKNYIQVEYDDLVMKSKKFAHLALSPIDDIKTILEQDNIKCAEISGRNFQLKNKKIEIFKHEPKTKIVKSFNDGECDVILITRAGASGISLHASQAFKDQRVRDLFELEITNRPTYRLQFIGRVNRKNQVHKPRFFSVITNLPFEQRILNIENQKLKKLQTHISGDKDKLQQENIFNFYNDYTDNCLKEYLQNHPQQAFQMGIAFQGNKGQFYYTDSILKRCIVLDSQQQNQLLEFMIQSVQQFELMKTNEQKPAKIQVDTWDVETFWHEMDSQQLQQYKKNFDLMPIIRLNDFSKPWVGIAKMKKEFHLSVVSTDSLKADFLKNYDQDEEVKNLFKNILSNFKDNMKPYELKYFEHHLKPILSRLCLGRTVSFTKNNIKIFGYIHHILYPKIEDIVKYPQMILLHLKTVNPGMHHSMHYYNENYYISLKDFFDAKELKIYDTPINWQQFKRKFEIIEKDYLNLIGNPIYMQFINNCYQFGNPHMMTLGGSQKFLVDIPLSITKDRLNQFKKPYLSANLIMEKLIKKEISNLSSSFDSAVNPNMFWKNNSQGYLLYVQPDITKNNDIFDYMLKNKLKDLYKCHSKIEGQTYFVYEISYKKIRMVLSLFEQKNFIWFA